MTDGKSEALRLGVMTLADSSRAEIAAAAAGIYALFARREAEFGHGADILAHSPAILDPASDPFLADPVGQIAALVERAGGEAAVAQVVVLTTWGERLHRPLTAAGFRGEVIDMPAGPDGTMAFTRDRGTGSRRIYVEAVNEADPKLSPAFALTLHDAGGALVGGACGPIHGTAAWLAMLAVAPGLPAGTGTGLAQAMIATLAAQGVTRLDLGTQTAGRFYAKLGFRVTHRLVPGLRWRATATGRQAEDLVMMTRAIGPAQARI